MTDRISEKMIQTPTARQIHPIMPEGSQLRLAGFEVRSTVTGGAAPGDERGVLKAPPDLVSAL
jgi:hypothetical protein